MITLMKQIDLVYDHILLLSIPLVHHDYEMTGFGHGSRSDPCVNTIVTCGEIWLAFRPYKSSLISLTLKGVI